MGWSAPGIGLALDVGIQYAIDLRCDELIAQGFSPPGLIIGQWINQEDIHLAPRFEMMGRVDRVNDGHLLLADNSSGFDSIEPSQAHLSPSHLNFQRCVKHVFREHARRIEPELQTQISAFLSGPKRLPKLQSVMERFSRLRLKMTPEVSFAIGTFAGQKPDSLNSTQANLTPPVNVTLVSATPPPIVQAAAKPVYVFDIAGQNTHLSEGSRSFSQSQDLVFDVPSGAFLS